MPEGWIYTQASSLSLWCRDTEHTACHQPIFCPSCATPSGIIHGEDSFLDQLQSGDALAFWRQGFLERGTYEGPHERQGGWYWILVRSERVLLPKGRFWPAWPP